MSRLPSIGNNIPAPSRRLVRQPSAADLRKRKTISENVPPVPKTSKSTHITKARSRSFVAPPVADRTMVTSPKPTKKVAPTFSIGDRVAVDSMGIIGTLKFLGETHFKEGYWAGIQLDINGSGKNDGSVNGKRYFTCPAQTGLFVLASKLSSLNNDSDSVRSLSPPQQQPISSNPKLTLVTTRAARYINMTANQLTQQKSVVARNFRSPTSSLNTPLTSPVSSQSRQRKSQPNIQSPTPTSHRSLPSPAMTPHHSLIQQIQPRPDDDDDDLLTDELLLTDIPEYDTTEESSDQRLERVLGEAIAQAPDEQVMKVQQLQLRVEVLEAENRFLKLEKTQNKTAEQILERTLAFQKEGGEIVLEIERLKETHAAESAEQHQRLSQVIQRLETKVQELEAEQIQLVIERDRTLFENSSLRKEKSTVEHRLLEAETKLIEAEAVVAAAQAKEQRLLEKTKSLQDQLTTNRDQQQYYVADGTEDSYDRQMRLEMELEEMHDKLNSLREAARAKDMFLTTLSEQVEIHRNAVEEKEREIRRVKADADRHLRDKEHVLTELKELESTLQSHHQECLPKEAADKLRNEILCLKEKSGEADRRAEDDRAKIRQLEGMVDELNRAVMESIELYERHVEVNRIEREAIEAHLADERRKVNSLEIECEELRKAGLDAIEAYEGTIDEMKKDRSLQFEDQAVQREHLQATIETLKQEIDQLMQNVASEEKHQIMKEVWESERKRLMDRIESLERDKVAHEALKLEASEWKEQAKELDRLSKEKSKLEEQVGRLQTDYEQQLQARNKYLDEIKASVESQKKTEGELRRLTETKDKLERELADTTPSMSMSIDPLVIETFRGEIEKLEAQNTLLMKQKQQMEQSQQDVLQYQQLIQTLKFDNAKVLADYQKLKESQKSTEAECLKLMEEVEKLHQQASQDEAVKLILNQDIPQDEKLTRLMQENQKNLEKLTIEHTTEIRQMKEKSKETEKQHKHELALLNRDISELESLIESKIFREADLEEALERERSLVKKLESQISDLKEDNVLMSANQIASTSSKLISKPSKVDHNSTGLYCEICEDYGHDLISCKAITIPPSEEIN